MCAVTSIATEGMEFDQYASIKKAPTSKISTRKHTHSECTNITFKL
jgi:hypothetical protein